MPSEMEAVFVVDSTDASSLDALAGRIRRKYLPSMDQSLNNSHENPIVSR
jgi:hypothetical protein